LEAEKFAGRLSKIPKVGHSAAEFWRAVWMYRCQQRSVAAAMLLSWVGQVGFVFVFYFRVQTLDPPSGTIPSVAQHFLLVPIGLVIQALLPLQMVAGGGVGEAGARAYGRARGVPPKAVLAGFPPMTPGAYGEHVARILADPRYAGALALGVRGDTGITILEEKAAA